MLKSNGQSRAEEETWNVTPQSTVRTGLTLLGGLLDVHVGVLLLLLDRLLRRVQLLQRVRVPGRRNLTVSRGCSTKYLHSCGC